VLDATGQWQDKERNTIVKEPSKDVRLIVPADAEVKEKLDPSSLPISNDSSSKGLES
jgi:hypothetical protein